MKQDPPNPLPEAIAPKPTRHWRGRVFQVYIASATLAFLALVILARSINYFPFDLSITRAIQSVNNASFFAIMWAVSYPGFAPQTIVIPAAIILLIFASGLRWEAIVATVAALGSSGLGTLVKLIVTRSRPTADLVLVFRTLDSYSFPSGHVLFYTAFFGFLFFLAYILLKPSFIRGLTLVILASFIVLVGPSRIYLGGHWASDVVGGYLFGSLWLTLSIVVYRWGKGRFFVHQPTAPEESASSAPLTSDDQ